MPRIVAGVDVGGEKKGFHAVALRDSEYMKRFASRDPKAVLSWLKDSGAQTIAIDSPCRWRPGAEQRRAERELNSRGIHCFSTPSHEESDNSFYGWIHNGFNLYQAVEADFSLFAGQTSGSSQLCIETFPHAVACALAREVVSAKNKSAIRRLLLKERGVENSELSNIDYVDAALCALAADAYLASEFESYGDQAGGFIVVPVGLSSIPKRRRG